MQEVLVATEKFEQECMEAAEREQREARKTKKPPSLWGPTRQGIGAMMDGVVIGCLRSYIVALAAAVIIFDIMHSILHRIECL